MKAYQYLLIGLLFFGALSLIGFFTIVSTKGPFAPKGKYLVIFFDNADGIKLASSVNVLGVTNGDVKAIDLIFADKNREIVRSNSDKKVGQRVAITIEILKDIVFYENYVIEIKNSALLGGKAVSIDPGTSIKSSNKNKETDVDIKNNKILNVLYLTKSSFSSSILEEYLNIFDKKPGNYVHLNGTNTGDPIAGISELVSENRQNVKETIQNIRDISDKIVRGQGTIGKLVYDDELHRNTVTLLSDAQIVVREVRESLEDVREQAPVDSFVRALLTAF